MRSIAVQNMDGNSEQITLVSSFIIPEINKKFAILSKGEAVGEGTAKLYIAEIFETGGAYKFIGIIDEVIWDKVKQTMKTLVQGGTVQKFRYESVAPSILEGYRIIGLKNSDLESIAKNSEDDSIANVEQTIDDVLPSNVSTSDDMNEFDFEPNQINGSNAELTSEKNFVPNTESYMNEEINIPDQEYDTSVEDTYTSNVPEENDVIGAQAYDNGIGNVSQEEEQYLTDDNSSDIESEDVDGNNVDRFDQYLLDTQKILEETRQKMSDILDEYDRRIMDLSTDYIDELEDRVERLEIENEAYRKAIGKVINNINIDE